MAKNRNSRSKSKPPAVAAPAVAKVAAPQPEEQVPASTFAPAPVLVSASAPSPKLARPLSSTSVERPPSHDEIARRAYELWLRRGAPHGTQLEDWLSAERELATHAA